LALKGRDNYFADLPLSPLFYPNLFSRTTPFLTPGASQVSGKGEVPGRCLLVGIGGAKKRGFFESPANQLQSYREFFG
jgi:hypothetical protein